MHMDEGWRIEHDSMGEVRVPAEHYWGAQTQRSLEHFPIGVATFRWGRRVIWALGVLKLAAARANEELGRLPQDKAELIARAATEVMPPTRSERSSTRTDQPPSAATRAASSPAGPAPTTVSRRDGSGTASVRPVGSAGSVSS